MSICNCQKRYVWLNKCGQRATSLKKPGAGNIVMSNTTWNTTIKITQIKSKLHYNLIDVRIFAKLAIRVIYCWPRRQHPLQDALRPKCRQGGPRGCFHSPYKKRSRMLSCWRETFLTKKDFATWKLRSSPRSSNAFYLLSSQCTQCSSPHCSSEVLGNASMRIPKQRNKESKTNLCRQTRRLDGTLEEGERLPWPRWTSSHWTGTSLAGGGESLDH